MIRATVGRLKRSLFREAKSLTKTLTEVAPPAELPHKGLVEALTKIPYWEDKINFYKKFKYEQSSGKWISHRKSVKEDSPQGENCTHQKVNYGCGSNLVPGWMNVDRYPMENKSYKNVDLLDKHPFLPESVRFGFSEDVLEHLTQAESIFFLSEIYRTLAPGGVMRLSFPGLEGVLEKHYTPFSEQRVRDGEFEAFAFWDHIHFYSKEELKTVAKHIGFKNVDFVEYGKSIYPELRGLDTRENQIGLNTYAELTK